MPVSFYPLSASLYPRTLPFKSRPKKKREYIPLFSCHRDSALVAGDLHHLDGQATAGGLAVLGVHVLAGDVHGLDHLVQ